MKKRFLSIMLVALCLVTVSCSNNNGETNTDNIESEQNKDNVEEKENEDKAESVDYSNYTGVFVQEKLLIQDFKYGFEVNLKVDKDGNVDGAIGSSTENASRFAAVDVKGKIVDNKFESKFEEDGWGHSGTVKITFKDSDNIVLDLEYTGNKEETTIWGLGEGSFELVRNTKEVKRTLNDLRNGGYVVQDNQTFDTKIENYGDIRFISGLKREDGNDIAVFYISDRDNNILYKLPPFYGNDKGRFEQVTSVAFMDLNKDDIKDILVIGKFISDESNEPINVASVYFQDGKEFKNDAVLDAGINDTNNNDKMESVVAYIKEGR